MESLDSEVDVAQVAMGQSNPQALGFVLSKPAPNEDAWSQYSPGHEALILRKLPNTCVVSVGAFTHTMHV